MSTHRTVGVGLIGLGTVGGGVAQLLRDHAELYEKRCGASVEVRSVLVRDAAKAAGTGLVDPALITDDPEVFFAANDMNIVAELAGGIDRAGYYVRRSIETGRHVVTANKALLAAQGSELFAQARLHAVSIGFEASCAGGIPCITALKFGLMANRFVSLVGILNGTCNYMLTEMKEKKKSYGQALADAQAAGYAEADPTLDVSGRDAADKLAILSSLAFGCRISSGQVGAIGIDTLDEHDVAAGIAAGYELRLLGMATLAGGSLSLMVEPCYVPAGGILAGVRSANNALMIEGDAVGRVMLYGPGAGRGPTASAVVSDLLNIASGWYPAAFETMGLTPDLHADAELLPADGRLGDFAIRSQGSSSLEFLRGVTAAQAHQQADGGRALRVYEG
ncbi:MAG: homoserine dehydrogenase [Phycisphaeraceae bacterium]